MKSPAALWLTVFQMAVSCFPWEIKRRRCTQWTGMTPYVWPVITHQQSSQPLREKTSHTANVGCVPRKGSDMTPAGTVLTVPASHPSVHLTASWTTTPSSYIGRCDQAFSVGISLMIMNQELSKEASLLAAVMKFCVAEYPSTLESGLLMWISLRLFGVGHSDWSLTNFITRLVCGESTVATLSWCIVVCEVALRWTKWFGFSGWCIFTWQWLSCHTDWNVSFYAFVTNRLVWWFLTFFV